jgi:hypothetical protein
MSLRAIWCNVPVDESGGFELTRVGGETQSSLRAQCRDEIVERGYQWCVRLVSVRLRPGCHGMEVSAHSRIITEIDGRPHGGSLSAYGRIHFALPSLHGYEILLVGLPHRTLR